MTNALPAADARFLADHWDAAWRALGTAVPADAVREELLRRWCEPQRRYHTPQHLAECLALFERHRGRAHRPGEVAIALWYHDAVYETAAAAPGANERASARLAADAVRAAGAAPAVADRVHALVLATRHDAEPAGADAALLVDIDLAILGAAPARFAEYERQIRAEYAQVPPALFAARRGEILRAFLARPAIYATPALRAELEAPARANLAAAIAGLG